MQRMFGKDACPLCASLMPKPQAADLVKQCLSQFLDVLRGSGMVTVEKQARLGKFLKKRASLHNCAHVCDVSMK